MSPPHRAPPRGAERNHRRAQPTPHTPCGPPERPRRCGPRPSPRRRHHNHTPHSQPRLMAARSNAPSTHAPTHPHCALLPLRSLPDTAPDTHSRSWTRCAPHDPPHLHPHGILPALNCASRDLGSPHSATLHRAHSRNCTPSPRGTLATIPPPGPRRLISHAPTTYRDSRYPPNTSTLSHRPPPRPHPYTTPSCHHPPSLPPGSTTPRQRSDRPRPGPPLAHSRLHSKPPPPGTTPQRPHSSRLPSLDPDASRGPPAPPTPLPAPNPLPLPLRPQFPTRDVNACYDRPPSHSTAPNVLPHRPGPPPPAGHPPPPGSNPDCSGTRHAHRPARHRRGG
jgi:hypothetical protein